MNETILGYSVTTGSVDECLSDIVAGFEEGGRCRYFVCANPHSLEVAREDREFELALKSADLVVPDGIGIVIASKILGGRIRERVTGMDIFLGLSAALNKETGFRYFFLGSTGSNLKRMEEKMKKDFPRITISGIYSPPFKDEFSDEDSRIMVDNVNRAGPDVLWVGMTAPKQEKWIYRNRDRLNVKFIGAVGAVFDFYTGNVKRSHPFFRKTGLEWLPRLLRQPRRLWRRNFISNPSFLLRVISSRMAGEKAGR